MKLLKRYKNKQNNIDYSLYKLDSGVNMIYLKNPASIDFDFALIHKAGKIYEDIEKVPHGTAHMLEHILFRPNKGFETDDEIYKFESGNKNRPAIYMNGRTSNKYLYLTGHTNQTGSIRLLERLDTLTEFSKEKLSKSFNTEKDIVLAEQSREEPTSKNKFLQNLKFLEEDVFPEFTYPIIGETEDIKSITLNNVESYFNNRFTKDNLIVAIQSSKLSKKEIRIIEGITNKYPKKESLSLNDRNLNNKLDFGSFADERLTGTAIYLSYFQKDTEGFNYTLDAVNNMLVRLIRKVGEENLRDKQGLAYSVAMETATFVSLGYIVAEIAIVVENTKVALSFEAINHFLFFELEEFLNSSKGDDWFEHILSTLIYPHTTQYNDELAENIACLFIENKELYNANKYKEALKKVTKKDLLLKVKELQSIPPHIWIESNLDRKEIEKIVKKSDLWKRFK